MHSKLLGLLVEKIRNNPHCYELAQGVNNKYANMSKQTQESGKEMVYR